MGRTRLKEIQSETQLAAHFVSHFRNAGHIVYEEACPGGMSYDIIARKGDDLWAIECKLQFNWAVLHQALQRQNYVPKVSVATLDVKKWNDRRIRAKVCEALGIGWIILVPDVFHPSMERPLICETVVEPRVQVPRYRSGLLSFLDKYDQSRNCSAGSKNGFRMTPFYASCEAIRAYVEKNPGCSIKDVVENVEHHWASNNSARSCIARYVPRKIIRGVRLVSVDKRGYCLYPIRSRRRKC